MAVVRLAPVDAAACMCRSPRSAPACPAPATAGAEAVQALTGAAFADIATDDPAATLAALDRIALATPRTRRLAGSAAEGRITWETRSALWAFSGLHTAETAPAGVAI